MKITRKQFDTEDGIPVELAPYVILHIPKLDLTDEQRTRMLDWAEKLESGKFQQTRGTLRKNPPSISAANAAFDSSYCCLGVACAISGIGEWGTNNEMGEVPHLYKGEYHVGCPSLPVREYFGMPSTSGIHAAIRYPCLLVSYKGLDGFNDEGASFEEIAKIIRLACADGYLNPEATPSELKILKRDGI